MTCGFKPRMSKRPLQTLGGEVVCSCCAELSKSHHCWWTDSLVMSWRDALTLGLPLVFLICYSSLVWGLASLPLVFRAFSGVLGRITMVFGEKYSLVKSVFEPLYGKNTCRFEDLYCVQICVQQGGVRRTAVLWVQVALLASFTPYRVPALLFLEREFLPLEFAGVVPDNCLFGFALFVFCRRF